MRRVLVRLKEDTMIIETKNTPECERPEYFIVKDNYHEYLVKREGSKQTLLLRAESREQVCESVVENEEKESNCQLSPTMNHQRVR